MAEAAGSTRFQPVRVAAAGSVVLTLCGLALTPINADVPEAAFNDFAIPEITAAFVFSVIGAWLAERRPHNAMGWLILLVGAGAAVSFFATQYAAVALVSRPSWDLPLAGATALVAQTAFVVPNVIQRGLILYAFPEGRLGTRAGRLLVVGSVLAAAAFAVAMLSVPYPYYESRPDVTAPLAPRFTGFSDAFFTWFSRLFAPLTALCMGALVLRLIRTYAGRRAPLALFAAAAAVSFVQFSVVQAIFPNFSEPVWLDAGLATLGIVAMATASVVAILRYQLWDIQVILRRSLLFVALTVCLAAGYLAVVAAVSIALPGGSLLSSLVAAAVVAAVAAPLRSSLQRGIDRLLFGDRERPDAALAGLGRRMGAAEDVDAILGEVAAGIATSLRVPYVALWVPQDGQERLAAARGRPTCGTEHLPLLAHGEPVGRLEIGLREPDVGLEGADRRLLDELSRQAALAVAIVQTTHELQRSRQALVGAREEERRRLRRDLHDGIGPALAANTLQLDEAADLVESDPASARQLLRRLRGGTQDLIAEVRRVVYDLRPPTLDELGIVGALRHHADTLSAARLSFQVCAEPEHLALPAAVEVATWRIATEGMTNVVRHAQAEHCTVRIRAVERAVEVEVIDDGRGIDGVTPGVGLSSARERAAELGGRCTISTRAEGGTLLRAWLPIPAP